MRPSLALSILLTAAAAPAQPARQPAIDPKLDQALLETGIPHLQALYASHRYTVTQVTHWYLDRIARYNGIYRAVQTVDAAGALATAAQQDAAPAATPHGPLWGVPIVIKANTAVKGLPDTDGWQGFQLPGHEFIAPRDATVVARLRAAGAIILGITNMPDFAASDTNRSSAFGRTGNAYDVRFSPGGSSGGTVTAVTSNEALLGTGTDTGNSIRMPSGTSSVVGVLPTRGLTSIAGIAPLDWLLDNTGPIARNVTDAAIALAVMAGPDPLDPRTTPPADAQQPPYLPYLKPNALKGKRLGVPAFILASDTGFSVSRPNAPGNAMRPETRALFMQSLDQLRAAGAEIVLDETLLPAAFSDLIRKIDSAPYRLDGTNQWLASFGPAQYHSAADYQKATGFPLPTTLTGIRNPNDPVNPNRPTRPAVPQVAFATDPAAASNFWTPQKEALEAYLAALDRLHLDAFVYPSAQMPPPDETMPQNGELSSGPHSNTGWVNRIGVPAIVVPAGFYPSGLPFGLELSARPWHDGDLLGLAFSYEQSTHLRHPPILVESGLLANAH